MSSNLNLAHAILGAVAMGCLTGYAAVANTNTTKKQSDCLKVCQVLAGHYADDTNKKYLECIKQCKNLSE